MPPLLSLSVFDASTPAVTSPVAIFLVVLGVILLVPIIFQRLKIPYVIGLIIAGIAIGPHGLNIVANDMSFQVFGQVGILYLMFLAGLEIDMYHLKKNLGRGAVFGAYTFILPLIIGFAAATLLLGLPAGAAMLLASMFAAHTLLAYPIVSRFGLQRNRAVIIAVAGTIVTVIGALMVLAVVGESVREGGFSWLELLKVGVIIALFSTAVIFLYPRLTRWFFKRYGDNIAQFIYVLAMVFLAACVSRKLGIEAVFGAFLGGLVMNRYVPARSPLMTRLEFVGNALFIPYFLIGVGMIIDLRILGQGSATWIMAGVMSATAICSKWLAALATQLTFRLSALDRSMLYQLSNAHTAVALAVVTIGYNMHLFNEEILNATVIMILVTCTVSTLGVERASRRLKLRQLTDEHAHAARRPERYRHRRHHTRTLITVSNPVTAASLVDLALMMRDDAALSSVDPVYALYVRGSEHSRASREEGLTALQVAEAAAAAVDAPITPIERYDINIVTGVLNTVAEREINEIIIGLHRRGNIVDSFFGSKIEQLQRSTNRMLMIVRCYIPVNTLTRIVVIVPRKAEFETGFRRWAEALLSLARRLGCRILFYCHPDTKPYLRHVTEMTGGGVRAVYLPMADYDDFVLMSGKVLDDDLLVVINARRASVSFDPSLDDLPDFLQRNFADNNLMIIYPEQFGDEQEIDTSATAMSADFTAAPVSLWLRLRNLRRRVLIARRRRRRK